MVDKGHRFYFFPQSFIFKYKIFSVYQESFISLVSISQINNFVLFRQHNVLKIS